MTAKSVIMRSQGLLSLATPLLVTRSNRQLEVAVDVTVFFSAPHISRSRRKYFVKTLN